MGCTAERPGVSLQVNVEDDRRQNVEKPPLGMVILEEARSGSDVVHAPAESISAPCTIQNLPPIAVQNWRVPQLVEDTFGDVKVVRLRMGVIEKSPYGLSSDGNVRPNPEDDQRRLSGHSSLNRCLVYPMVRLLKCFKMSGPCRIL